mgnify:CR=1 FL=1
MPLAYLGLGSNVGDRMEQMRRALELLENDADIRVLRASPVYQNRAVGMGEGADDFLNAVVEVSSMLEPLDLLDACLNVEQQLGRNRSGQGWAPRIIDLDILVYAEIRLRHARLILPHPRIAERDFVVVPLADLAPELKINHRSIRQITQSLVQNELTPYSGQLR